MVTEGRGDVKGGGLSQQKQLSQKKESRERAGKRENFPCRRGGRHLGLLLPESRITKVSEPERKRAAPKQPMGNHGITVELMLLVIPRPRGAEIEGAGPLGCAKKGQG